MKSRSLHLLACGLIFSIAPRVHAQDFLTRLDSCVNNIPASARKRVPVFIEASATADSLGILSQADFFAQAVAVRLRNLLGSHDLNLPEADSALAWNLLWGEVTLTAHRRGKPTWSLSGESKAADSLPRSPLRLLRHAVEDVIAQGETIMLPVSVGPDSTNFGLSFVVPTVEKSGKIIPLKARQPIPVFTIAVAWTKPVEVKRDPNIVYPKLIEGRMYVGTVKLGYVVTADGRVDPSTIRDIWPEGVAEPAPEILEAYKAFVLAAKRGLPTARFSPASIGGCAVNQRVEQKFDYRTWN